MTTRILFPASLAAALLVGGCSGTVNRGLESVHQPVVTRADYALDLGVQGDGLAYGERERLAGWMDAMHLGFGDRVALDGSGPVAPRARGEIAGIVAGYGLMLAGDAPVAAAPVAPGTVRVIVSRMTASVPGCPDWSRDGSHEFDSNMSSNSGCAVNSNLAAMVARPEDLVRGQGGSGMIDTASSAKAIDAYRKATPTGNGNTVKVESAKGK